MKTLCSRCVDLSNEESWNFKIFTLLSLSLPGIFSNFIQIFIPITSSLFVGHLGSEYLSAAILGNMVANASGYSFAFGLNMALDSLCSQAYGAKQYRLMGLHAQRSFIILSIVAIPIALLWLATEPLLSALGIPQDIATLSGRWIVMLIPGMPPLLFYDVLKRFHFAQKIVWPPTLSVAIVSICNALITYINVMVLDFGFTGAALSVSISNWLLLLIFVILIVIRKKWIQRQRAKEYSKVDGQTPPPIEDDPEDNWPPLSLDVFKGWPMLLKLGIPSSISLFLEWGSWEINSIFAAKIGKIDLAAHSILANTTGIWYQIPWSIAVAGGVLVGNSLGAKKSKDAQNYSQMIYIFCILYSTTNGLLSQIYGAYWGYLFVNEKAVVDAVYGMMPVLFWYLVGDVLKCCGLAVLRSCGRPNLTVIGNLVSCIFVGYPTSLVLVFVGGYGLPGLWSGMSLAWCCAGLFYLVILMRTDWNEEVKKAEERTVQCLNTLNKTEETKTIDLSNQLEMI